MKNLEKNIKLLSFLAFSFFFFTVPSMGQDSDVVSGSEKIFQRAVEDLNSQKYLVAEKGFESVLISDPNNLKARYYLGLIKYEQQLLPEAETQFQWVHRQMPDTPVIHYYLGRIAYDRKNWDEALKEMKTAHRLEPKFSMACYYLGLIYYQKKDLTNARSEFQEAINLESTLSHAHYGLAYLLFHDLKNFNGALSEIKAGLEGKVDSKLRNKFILLGKEIDPSFMGRDGKNGSPPKPNDFRALPSQFQGMRAAPPDVLPFDPRFPFMPNFGKGHFSMKDFQRIKQPSEKNLMEGLKKDLGLTDNQYDQLKASLEAHLKETKLISGKLESDVQELKKDIIENTQENKLRADLEKYSYDHKTWEDSESDFNKKAAIVLTPNQRAQLILNMSGMGVGFNPFFGQVDPNQKDTLPVTAGRTSDSPRK